MHRDTRQSQAIFRPTNHKKKPIEGWCQPWMGEAMYTYHNRWSYCHNHVPLTRYVKLRVVHAPGMPGTFSPPPTSKKTAS